MKFFLKLGAHRGSLLGVGRFPWRRVLSLGLARGLRWIFLVSLLRNEQVAEGVELQNKFSPRNAE